MIKEHLILRAFLSDRTTFEKYAPYIINLENLDRSMKITLGFIKLFYETYRKIDKVIEPEFNLFLEKEDKFNFLKNNTTYIQDIYKTPIQNNSLTLDVIESCVEQHIMSKVLDKAALVLDNNKSGILSSIQDDIDKFHSIIRNPPKDMMEYTLDLDSLIKDEITTMGIPFCNKRPNDMIRGMRVGQLGLIYAYVGTGKTSYGVSNLCSVASILEAKNSDRPVVYGGNEEAIKRITLRTIQCMTNWNDTEIAINKALVTPILKRKGFNRIHFIDHVTTTTILEKILDKYNPRVMFIDQGTNVKISSSKKEGVNALEELFSLYRDLAKRHNCTLICMAQGGEDCFDKQYPTLKDIYGSKSAIQGTLDWAISVGRTFDDVKYLNWRYFNITKTKGKNDNPKYECRFDTDRCQFKQVV